VAPRRYLVEGMKGIPVEKVRWLGGKLGKYLIEEGIATMGDV